MQIKRTIVGYTLIGIAAATCLIAFFFVEPIPQDPRYHHFSDIHSLFGIPNALNVLSNLPFLLVGIYGVIALEDQTKMPLNTLSDLAPSYFFLFFGTALIGLGSGFYHLSPNNHTLVWDRLPMTIGFMGFYSIVIAEFINEKLGQKLLLPLLLLGVGSVFYWWYTESLERGDLRFYAVIQFFPMITIPVILCCFKSKFSHITGYWIVLLTYFGAKVFEIFDANIHQALGVISGHSIKHILPAFGLLFLIKTYSKRVDNN